MSTGIPNRERSSLQDRVASLADAWEEIASGPIWHAPTCACCAGVGLPVVSLPSAEADFLDFLRSAAESEGDVLLSAAIGGVSDRLPFADWLRELPQSNLPQANLDRLLARVEAFVQSAKPMRGHFTQQ